MRIGAVVDIVSREDRSRILHGLASAVISSQRVDIVVAMTVCIGSNEVVRTVLIAIVHIG